MNYKWKTNEKTPTTLSLRRAVEKGPKALYLPVDERGMYRALIVCSEHFILFTDRQALPHVAVTQEVSHLGDVICATQWRVAPHHQSFEIANSRTQSGTSEYPNVGTDDTDDLY